MKWERLVDGREKMADIYLGRGWEGANSGRGRLRVGQTKGGQIGNGREGGSDGAGQTDQREGIREDDSERREPACLYRWSESEVSRLG
jgi:hypothetical protein